MKSLKLFIAVDVAIFGGAALAAGQQQRAAIPVSATPPLVSAPAALSGTAFLMPVVGMPGLMAAPSVPIQALAAPASAPTPAQASALQPAPAAASTPEMPGARDSLTHIAAAAVPNASASAESLNGEISRVVDGAKTEASGETASAVDESAQAIQGRSAALQANERKPDVERARAAAKSIMDHGRRGAYIFDFVNRSAQKLSVTDLGRLLSGFLWLDAADTDRIARAFAEARGSSLDPAEASTVAKLAHDWSARDGILLDYVQIDPSRLSLFEAQNLGKTAHDLSTKNRIAEAYA
ncbi:MAG: hypothetical protein ACHQ2Z_16630, partial [Elusimicrobiota bacterium]